MTIPGQKRDFKDKGSGGFTHFLSMPLPQLSQETYSLWRDEIIGKNYEELPARVLISPKLLHLTMIMLPLGEAGKVEKARQALRIIAPKIQELILAKGINGKLRIEFDSLEIFGTPDETRVVYLKLKEEGE